MYRCMHVEEQLQIHVISPQLATYHNASCVAKYYIPTYKVMVYDMVL